jgi:hemoglobin
MPQKNDIANITDIQLLVDTFYNKIKADDLIGPIFNGIIQDRWPMHLSKMYQFWQTILLEEHTYNGAPFPSHARLPIEKIHFDRWLNLFQTTLNDLFEGPKAKEALWRAHKMAELFQIKINYFKNNDGIALA